MTKAIPACAEFRGAENDRTIVVKLDDENFTKISKVLEEQRLVKSSLRVKALPLLNDKYPTFAFSPILIDIKIGEEEFTAFVTSSVPADCDNNVKFEFWGQDPTRKICAYGILSTDQAQLHLQERKRYLQEVGTTHVRLSEALQQPQGRSFTMGIGV